MPNKLFPVSFSIFLFFLFFVETVCAGGKMVIKPYIDTGMSYESNYFLEQDNERSIITGFVNPGLEFGYTTAKSSLLFNYELEVNQYDENDSPPPGEVSIEKYDYIGHDMDLAADSQITDRLNIGVEDSYILTRDPSRMDDYSNEIIKYKYYKNNFAPEIYYQFGDKFGFGIKYTYTVIDYDKGEDSKENRGAFNLHYNMNSLNSLDLQYQYWEKKYNSSITDYISRQAGPILNRDLQYYITSDYTSRQIMFSFNRELKYYTLTINGGYQDRTFDNSLQDDMKGFVWLVAISGTRPQMLFSISQNYNDTAIDNAYYIATRFKADIGHLFLEKLNVKLKGYYQNSDYRNNIYNREDNTYAVSCRLDYLRNEILSIGIESGFETRDSSESINNYDNSYGLISIKLNFNLGSK